MMWNQRPGILNRNIIAETAVEAFRNGVCNILPLLIGITCFAAVVAWQTENVLATLVVGIGILFLL
jgi:branched-subunit amino acid transport protein